jgi:hypothetical protein
MSTLDLVFDGKAFPVPRRSVFELFEHHLVSLEGTSYTVRSSVPLVVFQGFVDSLTTRTKIPVTQGNAVSLWFLASEFFLSGLASECATFSVPIDQFVAVSERVSELEHQFSSFSNRPRKLEEKIEAQEEGLENVCLALRKLKTALEDRVRQLRISLGQIQQTFKQSPSLPDFARPYPVPRPEKPYGKTEIPLKPDTPLDGIISHLTRRHGGNVHEKGIVTITSKSIADDPDYSLRNVAELNSDSLFISEDEPGQWVCWDFGKMRVCPTHYTVRGRHFKSWAVEGSVDGENWTEMDRQTDNLYFKINLDWPTAWFPVRNSVQCRFIRLTHTDKNHFANENLRLVAADFFGTLSE